MKFLLRRSGRHEATVRTTHYVGSRETATLIMRFASSGYRFDPPSYDGADPGQPIPGRRMLADTVRRIISEHGGSAYTGHFDGENMSAYEQAQLARWAIGNIRRLHPELDDAELRTFESEFEMDLLDDEEGW